MPYETLSQDSPEAQSLDLTKSNLAALSQLFPSVVRDGQVDVDALRQLVGEAVDTKKELYGLNWHGKKEARRGALTPSLGTLRPCKEDSVDWDTTKNLYIEGDNLEVLKLLQKSYASKVKMIYIDPPYNTGKDFVYTDNFTCSIENYKKFTEQEAQYKSNMNSSGRFHTSWLSMMYPRLWIARNLLCEDGVIFISIDETEFHNLKSICDEIFGNENFIADFVWHNKRGGGNDSKYVAIEHEYVVLYAKDIKELHELFVPYTPQYLLRYKNEDSVGKYFWDTFKRKSGKQYYPIVCPDGKILENDEHGNPISWLRSEERFKKDLLCGDIRFVKIGDNWSVQFKQRLPEGKKPRSIFIEESILDEHGTTAEGSSETLELFYKDVFDNPKPTTLIHHILSFNTCDNDIILDFFSGSATTAHAVLNQNINDGGHRRYILVQLPQNLDNALKNSTGSAKASIERAIDFLESIDKPHSLTEIGKERIRRAGRRVKAEAGLAGQNLDIGFRVYKLDSSNVKPWNPQTEDLLDAMDSYGDHLVAGRSNDDFLTEIMLKSGIELTEKTEEREIVGHPVHSLGHGQYYACMDSDLANDAEAVALGIAEWHLQEAEDVGGDMQDTCTVFVLDKAFNEQDAAKMNFVAILEQHGICNIKAL